MIFMFTTMPLTVVCAGKKASLTIIQFKQSNLAIYGLHNFIVDVRKNIYTHNTKRCYSRVTHKHDEPLL